MRFPACCCALILLSATFNGAAAQMDGGRALTGRSDARTLQNAAPSAADSTGARHGHRWRILGAIAGTIAGGLGAAGYVLNATAYHCVSSGPPCPDSPQTARR